jgi:hypothetical protein
MGQISHDWLIEVLENVPGEHSLQITMPLSL